LPVVSAFALSPASVSGSSVVLGICRILQVVDTPLLPSLLHQNQHVASRFRRSLAGVWPLVPRGLLAALADGPQLRRQAGLRNADRHPEMPVRQRWAARLLAALFRWHG